VAGVTRSAFAHTSERSFAGVLDERGIDWEYEPHRFVTERHCDGRIAEEFVPDFYLPALDLYVECTTMRSGLMSRKRRKARRAMEQYGISVVLVLLPAALDEDANGGLAGASTLEEADGRAEVDMGLGGEQLGLAAVVAGAFELLETPLTDVVLLRWGQDFEPVHARDLPSRGAAETSSRRFD
jgi:hypothetical protein